MYLRAAEGKEDVFYNVSFYGTISDFRKCIVLDPGANPSTGVCSSYPAGMCEMERVEQKGVEEGNSSLSCFSAYPKLGRAKVPKLEGRDMSDIPMFPRDTTADTFMGFLPLSSTEANYERSRE